MVMLQTDRLDALNRRAQSLRGQSMSDEIVGALYSHAESVAAVSLTTGATTTSWRFSDFVDRITTSRIMGMATMLGILGVILWLTIAGANVPSAMLAKWLFWFEAQLTVFCMWAGVPDWIHGFFVLGVYRGLAWVVAVMLPPMAIFFPIFTLLEDLGYLPRVAFNLDRLFKKAGAHGKQSLTMAMGFGCNAAGVVACRIIDSPRERTIAIITNNFIPCNGRWPMLIAMATIFIGGSVVTGQVTLAAAALVALVLFGVMVTLVVSWGLSKTLLRGLHSEFTLELPPFRRPSFTRIFVRAFIDRTLKVLWRAIIVAAPVCGIVWILANVDAGGTPLLYHATASLDGFGRALGMDGIILMAFLLGLPANEIVMPVMIMTYIGAGAMLELDSLEALKVLLVDENGWTWLTAVSVMLFSLLHYPCGTTIVMIYKETKSFKWTTVATLLPLGIAISVCYIVAQTVRALGLV